MVSWYLTFALTEYYRYTKTFGLAHLNLPFCSYFIVREMHLVVGKWQVWDSLKYSLRQFLSTTSFDRFWPVLTSFDRLWERAANNDTDSLTQPQRCNEQLTISRGSIILTFVWRLSLMILKTLGLTTSISSWGLYSTPSIWSCLASPFNALGKSPWRTQKLS